MKETLPIQKFDRIVNLNPLFSIPQSSEEADTFSQKIAYLLSNTHEQLPDSDILLEKIYQDLPSILSSAFKDEDNYALLEIHKTLFQIYETSLSHPLSKICLHEHSPWLITIRNEIETAWLNYETSRIKPQLPNDSEAQDPNLLCAWFREQADRESDLDKCLLNFLRHEASIEQFNLFILSDAILNYRFCDALALAQLHFSDTVKAEIVRNMYDECGNGELERFHSRQFSEMLIDLKLQKPTVSVWGDYWQPYAGHNLYFILGLNRKHYFKSMGSLAMPELFDPNRDRAVVACLVRLYSRRVNYNFYSSHIETDEVHGSRWLSNIIDTLVKIQSEAGMELAIGGALRMQIMRDYNKYLAVRFGLSPRGIDSRFSRTLAK